MADKMAPSPRFDVTASPSHLLHRAQQLAVNQSVGALRSAGITLRQFTVLAALAHNDGVSQTQLVDETGIDRSTLADMVARMEQSGLVARMASAADARAKLVSLTALGQTKFDTVVPAVEAADVTLLASLPKSRRGPFLAVLAVLAEVSSRDALKDKKKPSKKKKNSKKKKKLK